MNNSIEKLDKLFHPNWKKVVGQYITGNVSVPYFHENSGVLLCCPMCGAPLLMCVRMRGFLDAEDQIEDYIIKEYENDLWCPKCKTAGVDFHIPSFSSASFYRINTSISEIYFPYYYLDDNPPRQPVPELQEDALNGNVWALFLLELYGRLHAD